ncbi:RidA family protein [Niveispirillum irakense]|uniref:RidA family protein n=1 Tax=Niveispirillum irakense TaxID=34011 RepID=UPI0003FBDF71|nr:RidA family protein [Niveispirillum irakense]
MSIVRLQPGRRMSEAAIHNGTVYLAGQVATDNNADIKGQTAQVLAQIDALLAEAGSDKSKILSTTIYLSSIGNFAAMNEVWDAWVDQSNPPARATVEARLATPGYLVEIVCIAAQG